MAGRASSSATVVATVTGPPALLSADCQRRVAALVGGPTQIAVARPIFRSTWVGTSAVATRPVSQPSTVNIVLRHQAVGTPSTRSNLHNDALLLRRRRLRGRRTVTPPEAQGFDSGSPA